MNTAIMLNYSKLWKLMLEKSINKTQLHEMAQISTNAVAKLSKNEPVSLDTLGKICYVLKCDIGDIMEIVIGTEGIKTRSEKPRWAITVAKSGVLEIEADSEDEAIKAVEDKPMTTRIQWEDSWNIVDIDRVANE